MSTNSLYVNLTRQDALLREIDVIATNLANANTTGYRREGVVFSEFIRDTDGPSGSLAMTAARVRFAEQEQGALVASGGQLDFAIEGDGFFVVGTPEGERLTRAGAFTQNELGELTTLEGYRVLGPGGGPIFVPPEAANVSVSPEGVVAADGAQVGQIGLVVPTDPAALRRTQGVLLISDAGVQPATEARIAQGFLESSNVDMIQEVTRMIEVQRAYELGQSLVDGEDQRLERTMQALGRPV
ncbi:MAG: flagellar hook-basal body complex protein [Pseudomonadota bacterium]